MYLSEHYLLEVSTAGALLMLCCQYTRRDESSGAHFDMQRCLCRIRFEYAVNKFGEQGAFVF